MQTEHASRLWARIIDGNYNKWAVFCRTNAVQRIWNAAREARRCRRSGYSLAQLPPGLLVDASIFVTNSPAGGGTSSPPSVSSRRMMAMRMLVRPSGCWDKKLRRRGREAERPGRWSLCADVFGGVVRRRFVTDHWHTCTVYSCTHVTQCV